MKRFPHAPRSPWSRRPRPVVRQPRRERPLILEPLEVRAVPAVMFVPGALSMPQVTHEFLPVLDTFVTEPAVSINPSNPANVVVSTQNFLQVSTNGGGTFSTPLNFPLPAGATGRDGDTSTAFDSTGRLFWANLATFPGGTNPDGSTYPQFDTVAVTEVDPATGLALGTTSVVLNAGHVDQDKEFLAVDANPSSPFHDNLYLSFAQYNKKDDEFEQFVSVSTNHGVNWSTQQLSVNSGANSEGFTWPSTVTVAPNGDVYVAYHSQPDLNDTNVEGATTSAKNPSGMSGQTIVFRSTNGGDQFLQRSVPFTQSESDITYNRQDGTSRTIPGATFWTMGSAQPWVLADPVRPGNIYVVTADDSGDGVGTFDPADVVMATSTNNGQNWSRQTVDAGIDLPGGGSRSFQLFPTASIDQSGDIVVAWYDNRSGLTNSSGDYLLDVYARYSKDGGVTWSNAFQVNTTHFDPDAGAQTRFNGPPATTRIGEYFGIAINNGTAYVAWNGNRFNNTGNPIGQQVYMGSFQLNGSLNVDQPNATGRHTVTIQPLAGAPTNNYIEITDTTDASGASVREYIGMGNDLGNIFLNDRSTAYDTINVEKTYSSNNVNIAFEDGGGVVVVSPFAQNLDNIVGPVNVSSNFGVGTTLYIDDGNNPRAGDAWTLSSGSLKRAGRQVRRGGHDEPHLHANQHRHRRQRNRRPGHQPIRPPRHRQQDRP
jgi:hypothetical protein